MAGTRSGDKLKVFISYSRRDSSDFAEELVTGLELAGFAPFLDRHDIAPGEPWEERLAGLIHQADTVVFVISPEAVRSERCDWEVDRTLALSKRLIPVVFKRVPEADIPEQLGRRQFIRFDTGSGITRPLSQLAEALRHDTDWIREHTRLGDLSVRWEARGRPESLLLRGEDVLAALAWVDHRKPDAPLITDLMRAYITTSKQAEAADLAKSKTAQRYSRRVLAFAALCLFTGATVAIGWWNQDWLSEKLYWLVHVRGRVLTEQAVQSLKPRDVFQECVNCPPMVVLPVGRFQMGSSRTDKGARPSEVPQHAVILAKPFAVSKFPVTYSEWDECVAEGGCNGYKALDIWGRGLQPVIAVQWRDAVAYTEWLSKITGKRYRLLSEAEWEYAARSGKSTGDDEGLIGDYVWHEGNSGGRTHPVGTKKPNAFGLYDMVGNVAHWVEDCFHENYVGAPTDGTAWTVGDCQHRMVRGSTYLSKPSEILVAQRFGVPISGPRSGNVGFRVARTLNP